MATPNDPVPPQEAAAAGEARRPGYAASRQGARSAPQGSRHRRPSPLPPALHRPRLPRRPAKPPTAGTPRQAPGQTRRLPAPNPRLRPPRRRPPKPVKKPVKGTGKRKIGQVLVDLGFIDEDQLWDILDEAKATGKTVGQVAVGRGLITEDQLLQALADSSASRSSQPRRSSSPLPRPSPSSPKRWPASTRCCRSPTRTRSSPSP